MVVVLTTVALCAGMVLSEVAFRTAKHVVCMPGGDKLFRPHPIFGWTHKAGAEGWGHGCLGRAFEWRAFSRINADGLRDRPYPHARTPGVARVLLLGDSFTEGMQVAPEKTFAKRLEVKLHENGREVEVVNGGFSGFGTDNELLFFTVEGARYRPDLVLLGFSTANDVIENSASLYRRMYAEVPGGAPAKPYFRLQPDGSVRLDTRAARRQWEEFEQRRMSLSGRVWSVLEDNLHLVRLAKRVLSSFSMSRGAARMARSTALGIYATRPSPAWERAWAVTGVLLVGLRREAEDQGAAFAAVVIPAKEAVSADAWERQLALSPELRDRSFDVEQPTRRIVRFFEQEAVPHLDLLPILRSHFQATRRTGYFFWDVHFDEEGHELVADALVGPVGTWLDGRGVGTPPLVPRKRAAALSPQCGARER